MRYALFTEMPLSRDLPEHGLRRGDVVRIIEDHRCPGGREGYCVEVCNAVGDTIAVTAALLEPLECALVCAAVQRAGALPSRDRRAALSM